MRDVAADGTGHVFTVDDENDRVQKFTDDGTFVTSWNDFLWPSLMLHTPEGMTLPVGLAALQGFFASDFRSIAAGVTMTVIPILLFFIVVQRYFVRGLAGAVKG